MYPVWPAGIVKVYPQVCRCIYPEASVKSVPDAGYIYKFWQVLIVTLTFFPNSFGRVINSSLLAPKLKVY